MSMTGNQQKESRWSKLKRGLKKGAKKVAVVAASMAVGAVIPSAGAALYQFLKSQISGTPFSFNIEDEILKELCIETISKKSVEYLQHKLEERLKQSTTLTDEQLQLTVGALIRPLNESLNEVLDYIKTYPEQISYLINEWKAENGELLKQFQLEMDAGFSELQTAFQENTTQVLHGITQILTRLSQLERSMDNTLASVVRQIFSTPTITPLDLQVVSRAQLAQARYSSRFDIVFDPDLFVIREEADTAFNDFLLDCSSAFSMGRRLFLLLAGAGMGKTWSLASWAQRLSEGGLAGDPDHKFVPFYISLKLGLDTQLLGYFGAANKTAALNNLRKAMDTSGCIPILLLDGLDEISPQEAKSVLSFILALSKEHVPVVLACRDTDWAREEKIIDMHPVMADLCFEHISGKSYTITGLSCLPSLYLDRFTEQEFLAALVRYQIPLAAFYTPHQNPAEFQPLFLGEPGDPPETHILGRLGIIGTKRNYLVRVVRQFLAKGPALKGDDLLELIREENNFKAMRSAGLLRERWDPVGAVFVLDELFYPHLKHLVDLASGVPISQPIPEQTELPAPPALPKAAQASTMKAPFRSQLVKLEEIQILKTIQQEINQPIPSLEVNSEGSVTALDFSSIHLTTPPKALRTLPTLMRITFSKDSFESDEGVQQLLFDGKDVSIEGTPYVPGQITERIRQSEEKKLRQQITSALNFLDQSSQEALLQEALQIPQGTARLLRTKQENRRKQKNRMKPKC
ncbi:MAG: hypothetical protein ACTSRC_18070 [Candidatus Helarchaeota archaeon]